MNILHVTNKLNHADGVSAHLYNLANELNRNYNMKAGIICSGGDAVNKFTDAGIEIIENKNLNHSTRSMKNFASAVIFLYKTAKSNNINILHSHNHYAANISFKSSKFSGVRTIQTIHGIIPDCGRLSHHPGENFVAVNDHVFRSLKSKLKNLNRIELIYNGLDFNEDIRKKKNKKLKFIAASRFEPGKGLNTFINAVGGLPEDYRSRADFIIAGEGSLEAELKKLSKKINADIIFPGMIRNLKELFMETDVFVIPSENEGFPITMLEAAATLNLVISSDFDGVETILTDNEDGLIFRKNDADELSRKIMHLIDNPESAVKYSAAFFKKAKAVFSLSEMGRKHFNFYKSLI